MIEHGPDIQFQLENSVCKSDLAISQLLMYNYHAKTPKVSTQQRHEVDYEPPFCIYIEPLIFTLQTVLIKHDTGFFLLDHVNYARWLQIHHRDMTTNIAINQAHEQNSAIVKGEGGAICLTEDPSALRRWIVAGPEVSRVVEEFEISSGMTHTTTDERHQEDSSKTLRDFVERGQRLSKAMIEFGNTFLEESSDLYTIDYKEIVESKAGNISNLEDIYWIEKIRRSFTKMQNE